jgi:hypothetical protein
MFTADEVSSVVDLAKLKELKRRIVHLFLYENCGNGVLNLDSRIPNKEGSHRFPSG